MNLKTGDTIGIIALSGDCDREKIERAKANIEALGFKTKLSKNIFDKKRYLAGYDEDKTEELHKFFKDEEIKLILCARGGYGAIRLINKIDYNIINANPKPICGFSDVTALLLMIWKRTGIITYHSPMAQSDFYNPSPLTPLPQGARGTSDAASRRSTCGRGIEGEGARSKTIKSFFEAVNNKRAEYKITKTYYKGEAKGILFGGNLSTVVSLCGQDFLPESDFIFFAEDLNEPVYKIDRMFQQLINIDDFRSKCKGIIIGDFLDVDNEVWLEEYFTELASRLQIPVVKIDGLTHADNKITLPIGADVKIKAESVLITPRP